MINKAFQPYLLLLVFFFFTSFTYAKSFYPANEKAFSYTGRIDFSQPHKALLSWPGSSIKANIIGQTLKVTFDDEQGKNYFNIIIDENIYFPAVLALKKGKHTYDLSYLIAHKEANDTTQIELFKRTEGHEGASYFHGLLLASNAKLLSPPPKKNRSITFFGDSVTTGMGNEAANNAPDNNSADKNHYWSYAAITARALKADHHAISSSGIGFMVSWFDYTMPDVYNQISGVGNNQSKWDFQQWQPDVVVVNLGQNDSWLIDNEKRIQATKNDIITAYEAFINTLKAHYPNATFVVALGSMDITAPHRKHWPAYVQTAINNLNKADKESNIHYVELPYTGFTHHPRIQQHQKNAAILTKEIKRIMQW